MHTLAPAIAHTVRFPFPIVSWRWCLQEGTSIRPATVGTHLLTRNFASISELFIGVGSMNYFKWFMMSCKTAVLPVSVAYMRDAPESLKCVMIRFPPAPSTTYPWSGHKHAPWIVPGFAVVWSEDLSKMLCMSAPALNFRMTPTACSSVPLLMSATRLSHADPCFFKFSYFFRNSRFSDATYRQTVARLSQDPQTGCLPLHWGRLAQRVFWHFRSPSTLVRFCRQASQAKAVRFLGGKSSSKGLVVPRVAGRSCRRACMLAHHRR